MGYIIKDTIRRLTDNEIVEICYTGKDGKVWEFANYPEEYKTLKGAINNIFKSAKMYGDGSVTKTSYRNKTYYYFCERDNSYSHNMEIIKRGQ